MVAPSCLVVWDPRFEEYDLGPEHPFQERSRRLAVRLLERSIEGADPPFPERLTEVAPATRTELESFHQGGYLDRLSEASATGHPRFLDAGDTPTFLGCLEASARIVGGAIAGVRSVLEGRSRTAFHPSGGLHHAHPDRASGFCILNDPAVAIATALRPIGPLQRIAYIDVDAHHGDGVMYGFYDRGSVLDIDFHQDGRTLFPGTGAVRETGRGDGSGLKVNVPVPPGTGEADFRPLFLTLVPAMPREYRPELIVLQHGVDGHLGDPLASLSYGPSCYDLAVRCVRDLADELCGGRLVVTGGGGYRPEHVARVLARAGRQLSGLPLPDGPLPPAWRGEFSAAF
ncbi:MAG TPA: acetoin utilization protein AcuC, partial [Thermoplasmata archaeon]|nr:acetoin utilization protein AcuC [Thermoplasmata archaeon]